MPAVQSIPMNTRADRADLFSLPVELHECILSNIDDAYTLRSLCNTCSHFARLVLLQHRLLPHISGQTHILLGPDADDWSRTTEEDRRKYLDAQVELERGHFAKPQILQLFNKFIKDGLCDTDFPGSQVFSSSCANGRFGAWIYDGNVIVGDMFTGRCLLDASLHCIPSPDDDEDDEDDEDVDDQDLYWGTNARVDVTKDVIVVVLVRTIPTVQLHMELLRLTPSRSPSVARSWVVPLPNQVYVSTISIRGPLVQLSVLDKRQADVRKSIFILYLHESFDAPKKLAHVNHFGVFVWSPYSWNVFRWKRPLRRARPSPVPAPGALIAREG